MKPGEDQQTDAVETWYAVYRCDSAGSINAKIWALFRQEEDAETYHCNPELYRNCRRRVRVNSVPIEVLAPTSDMERAVGLLAEIVEDNDSNIAAAISQARQLLTRMKKKRPATPTP